MSEAQSQPRTSYHGAAKILHWVMALGFLAMLVSGFALKFSLVSRSVEPQVFDFHKAAGVLMLIAIVLRIVVRFLVAAPAKMAGLSRLDRILSRLTHESLYVLMIAMPVSGWIIVSTDLFGIPTSVFGLFDWPNLPGLTGREDIEGSAFNAHSAMAWVVLGLIALHLAGTFKHLVLEKSPILRRMWFGKS